MAKVNKPNIFIFSSTNDASTKIIRILKEKLDKHADIIPWKFEEEDKPTKYGFRSGVNFFTELKNLPYAFNYFVFIIDAKSNPDQANAAVFSISASLLFELGFICGFIDFSNIYIIADKKFKIENDFPVYIKGHKWPQVDFEQYKEDNFRDEIVMLSKEILNQSLEATKIKRLYHFEYSIKDLDDQINDADGLIPGIAEFIKDLHLFRNKGRKKYFSEVYQYSKKVFFQKLLYSAYRMDQNVVSANLWVSKFDALMKKIIISEDREGYFRVNQLILMTSSSIDYRFHKVPTHESKKSQSEKNSKAIKAVAAEAIYKRKIVFKNLKSSFLQKESYEESPEGQLGTTDIIGIPLFSEEHPEIKKKSNTPLSLTIDIAISPGRSGNEDFMETLRAKAEQIKNIGEQLNNRFFEFDAFFSRNC